MQKNSNTYVVYKRDLEYLLAGIELLSSYKINSVLQEIYANEFVKKKQEEFPLLFEFYQNIAQSLGMGILEPILEFEVSKFSVEGYFSFLQNLPRREFISKFLQQPLDVIDKVMESEQEQISFYQNNKEIFSAYFVVETLFQRTEVFLKLWGKFVQSLKIAKAEEYLTFQNEKAKEWMQKLNVALSTKEPLHVSEDIMGKQFYNRGPYIEFYFMPSCFMPIKACRWFEKNQLLIFNMILAENKGQQLVTEQLKALSDKTRYQILILLSEKGILNGIEIAEKVGIATSTVSHHMAQMKNCGLVNEEPVRNTKYYSINKPNIKKCIEILEKTFL